MASGKEFLEFVLEQLSQLESVTCRPRMGEYILYYRGKVFGGIYDNRLLLKPVKSAVAQFSAPVYEAPYPGGKEMLLVEQADDRQFLADTLNAMYPELPTPRKPRKKP